MTTIKIAEKTLIVEDGAVVEISGDEIRVKSGPAPQPVYVPAPSPYGPFSPIYPMPTYAPWPWFPDPLTPSFCGDPYPPNVTTGLAMSTLTQ
jgi:hypothetical protein